MYGTGRGEKAWSPPRIFGNDSARPVLIPYNDFSLTTFYDLVMKLDRRWFEHKLDFCTQLDGYACSRCWRSPFLPTPHFLHQNARWIRLGNTRTLEVFASWQETTLSAANKQNRKSGEENLLRYLERLSCESWPHRSSTSRGRDQQEARPFSPPLLYCDDVKHPFAVIFRLLSLN
jgi:hypothetical protein